MNQYCYHCPNKKEPDRIRQPFCKRCATEAMRKVRANNVMVNLPLAESIVKLLKPGSYEYSKLKRIVTAKKERNEKRLKRLIK